MPKGVLINAAVSLAVSALVLLCAIALLRQHIREEVDRSLREREERFVSAYRERVLKIRREFGLPEKLVTTVEDVFEPMLIWGQ